MSEKKHISLCESATQPSLQHARPAAHELFCADF
jgi:hypothetical protein